MKRTILPRRGALWLRDQRGASAVEFALIAPILFVGLLSTIDIGLAITERMNLDHVLRAGAQNAMTDQGKESVMKVLQTTASENFVITGQADANPAEAPVTLAVDRFCACAEHTDVAVACSTICTGSAQTFAYYRLSAAKVYDGMILPQIAFKADLQVQVR